MKTSLIAVLSVSLAMIVGCAAPAEEEEEVSSTSDAVKYKGTLDAPSIQQVVGSYHGAHVRVCGGPSGMPGGITIQWRASDVGGAGYFWPIDDQTCSEGFNKASAATDIDGCATVEIGAGKPADLYDACSEGISCGTSFIVRAFAQGTSSMYRSAWSNVGSGQTSWCGCGANVSGGEVAGCAHGE